MVVTARSVPCSPAPQVPARKSGAITPITEPDRLPVAIPALYGYLQQVPDPRDPRGVRHPLPALLALVCLAWLSGIHGYLPAHDWVAALPAAERQALGFTRTQAPAASTLFEVLQRVSWEALETQLRRWVVAVQAALAAVERTGSSPGEGRKRRRRGPPPVDAQAVAIDGKALRGSWKRGAEIAGLLAVVSHRLALTVAQTPLPSKEGELTAVRPLLKKLLLEGVVVTVDAQFTQTDIAETICERGGEYVMRVKANQPWLLQDVQALLSPACYDPKRRRSTSTHETGHGRIENRQLVVHSLTPEQQVALAWPHAQQVFAVISQGVRRGKPCKPTIVYGVTSLSAAEAGAERLLRLYRGHWTVENRAFWERDVVFGEDASPACTSNVAVLACLRGAIMNLVRVTQGEKGMASAVRHFNANRAHALRALGCL